VRLPRFVARWRGWARGLRYGLQVAKSAQVRVEWCLELRLAPDDDAALLELRTALPGWTVAWSDDDRVRLVPPAYHPESQ